MSIQRTHNAQTNTLTIAISGRFDFEVVKDFRASYADQKAGTKYILDLRQTEHMDSSALGMLLNMRKALGDDCPISITNCRPAIKKILTISRFDKKFDIE